MRFSFAAVSLPERFTDAPESAASPPAMFWPVAESAPDATTFRPAPWVTTPSLFTPEASVPVELIEPAPALTAPCAASAPLFAMSPEVFAESEPWA